MPGMTPDAAFEDFAKPIRAAVACVDPTVWLTSRTIFDDVRAILPSSGGVQMSRKGDTFKLDTLFWVRPIRIEDDSNRWRVTTIRYVHVIRDQHGKVVAEWHWHPKSHSRVQIPHMHVADGAPWKKLHFPTGRVLIEDVVWFAIAELGVDTLRQDWEDVLKTSGNLQRQHSSW